MQNFIIEFKNALSPDYCQQLINKFEQSQEKIAGRTGSGVDKSKKNSLDLHLSNAADWQEERNAIAQIILKATIEYAKVYPFILTGAVSPSIQDAQTGKLKTLSHEDISQMNDQEIERLVRYIYSIDDINMQRYTKGSGGYHHWHSEHFPHPTDPSQRSLHRVLLWLVYLNDVKDGGETEFFYQQTKVKPTQGSIVLAPCGFSHTHRGCVPTSGDKYVLASWVMYNNAAQLYGQKS
ncbi:MAG: 2OG-Fe(II) oxygenase [Colwellia sp.]|nr:2OG-Fe(II) oxygenase [Colwellia sp.]MCW9081915.1 2OG-Fe(II) oxygenase [Colwellia sp.]